MQECHPNFPGNNYTGTNRFTEPAMHSEILYPYVCTVPNTPKVLTHTYIQLYAPYHKIESTVNSTFIVGMKNIGGSPVDKNLESTLEYTNNCIPETIVRPDRVSCTTRGTKDGEEMARFPAAAFPR